MLKHRVKIYQLDRYHHPLISQYRAGKYSFGFPVKSGQVFVAGGIMTDNKAFHPGVASDLRRLPGGGMEGFFGTGEVALGKSRFMIEQVHPFDDRNDRTVIGRIGTERIALGRGGRTRQVELGTTSPSGVT